MQPLRRFSIAVALANLATVSCLGAGWAQDPRTAALRDVSTTRIAVLTDTRVARCALDPNPLERRAREILQAAGLQTFTVTDVLERNRLGAANIARDKEARRRGEQVPSLDQGKLERDMEFLKSLPSLMPSFDTRQPAGGSEKTCALVVRATFHVSAAETPTTGATENRVSVRNGVVWQARPTTSQVPEPELPDLALRQLEATVGAFVVEWRRANGR